MRLVVLFATIYLLFHTVDGVFDHRLQNFTFMQTVVEFTRHYFHGRNDLFRGKYYIRLRSEQGSILGLVVDSSVILGPAQLNCWIVPDDVYKALSPINITEVYDVRDPDRKSLLDFPMNVYAMKHDRYNDKNFANNIGKIYFSHEQFPADSHQFPVVSAKYRPKIGEKLVAVYMYYGELVSKAIRVIDHKYCKKDFGPDVYKRVSLIEQICVKTSYNMDYTSFPDTLLFKIFAYKVLYVGNVSRNGNRYSLATLVGEHCEFIDPYGIEVCNHEPVENFKWPPLLEGVSYLHDDPGDD